MTDEGKLRTWQELESDHRPAQLNQGMRLGVRSAALQSRYANAFRQAGSLVTLGQIVKVLGIFVGGLVFLAGSWSAQHFSAIRSLAPAQTASQLEYSSVPSMARLRG